MPVHDHLAKVSRILDYLWLHEPDMTMQQAVILVAVARQEGMTLALLGEETGASAQTVHHACKLLATPAPVALPSVKRPWKGPRPEGTRLGLVEIRAAEPGETPGRRVFLTDKGREALKALGDIARGA
jgi:DNA-binding MarR family transcriptional regulator